MFKSLLSFYPQNGGQKRRGARSRYGFARTHIQFSMPGAFK